MLFISLISAQEEILIRNAHKLKALRMQECTCTSLVAVVLRVRARTALRFRNIGPDRRDSVRAVSFENIAPPNLDALAKVWLWHLLGLAVPAAETVADGRVRTNAFDAIRVVWRHRDLALHVVLGPTERIQRYLAVGLRSDGHDPSARIVPFAVAIHGEGRHGAFLAAQLILQSKRKILGVNSWPIVLAIDHLTRVVRSVRKDVTLMARFRLLLHATRKDNLFAIEDILLRRSKAVRELPFLLQNLLRKVVPSIDAVPQWLALCRGVGLFGAHLHVLRNTLLLPGLEGLCSGGPRIFWHGAVSKLLVRELQIVVPVVAVNLARVVIPPEALERAGSRRKREIDLRLHVLRGTVVEDCRGLPGRDDVPDGVADLPLFKHP